MGYMRHHAIIVTSFNDELVAQAHVRATELEMSVTDIVKVPLGYSSFLVGPDGSKEGWGESDAGDVRREAFIAWLDDERYDDNSTSLDWVVVQYGDDDMDTHIVRDGDEHRRAGYGMPNRLGQP